MYIGQRNARTILVIDDNAVVLEVTRSTLEHAGFRVVTRDRASGAIAAVLQERPDLVLLDVNMPNMTGDSLADVLSRTRAAPEAQRAARAGAPSARGPTAGRLPLGVARRARVG